MHRRPPFRSPFPSPPSPAPADRTAPEGSLAAEPRNQEESCICGWNAVSAVFLRRPQAVLRLFFDEGRGKRAGAWASALAAERKIYRQVPPEELEKVAGTVHHGGIVAVVRQQPTPPVTAADASRWASEGRPLLLLDAVANPHNLGLVARTAAFFGYGVLIHGDPPGRPLARLPDAAYRLAEGGLEHLSVHREPDLAAFCQRERARFSFIGASLDTRAQPLASLDFRRLRRPPAIVLGNEETGLRPEVAARCEHLVTVPGCGAVQSLNVGAAAAVLLHHFLPLLKRQSA